jgi:hypothetical protein
MDLVQNPDAASWLLTKWIFELGFRNGKVLSVARGMYSREFDRNGGNSSESGDFSLGFGACPEEHKPAVLWFYNRVLEPGPEKTYDVMKYPHHAAYAFVNWPLGVKEKDPAELFGHVLADRRARYYIFRSGWKGEDDVIATIGGMQNPWNFPSAGMCTGMGLEDNPQLKRGWNRSRGGLLVIPHFSIRYLHQHDAVIQSTGDGTYQIRAGEGVTVVDVSGLAGAPLLLVTVLRDTTPPPAVPPEFLEQLKKLRPEPPAIRRTPDAPPEDGGPYLLTATAGAGGLVFHVAVFQKIGAPHIEVAVEGRDVTLIVGKRKIVVSGSTVVAERLEGQGQSPSSP